MQSFLKLGLSALSYCSFVGKHHVSRAAPARGSAHQRLVGALYGAKCIFPQRPTHLGKAPTRRGGQALPGAFGLIPGKEKDVPNVRSVRALPNPTQNGITGLAFTVVIFTEGLRCNRTRAKRAPLHRRSSGLRGRHPRLVHRLGETLKGSAEE